MSTWAEVMSGPRCPCGAIHEFSAETRAVFLRMLLNYGTESKITTPQGTWMVPKVYIAAHGLRADELPHLAKVYGFKKVENG